MRVAAFFGRQHHASRVYVRGSKSIDVYARKRREPRVVREVLSDPTRTMNQGTRQAREVGKPDADDGSPFACHRLKLSLTAPARSSRQGLCVSFAQGIARAQKARAVGSQGAKPFIDEYKAKHDIKYATVEQVADHVDHVRKLVGVDLVGLGSDFDGLGDTLSDGLKDVSMYPNLIRVLIERGYSDEEIEKICSGNVLRVWEAAIRLAAK